MAGFHMKEDFTEREFQTNYNVFVETVIKTSWMLKYSISLGLSGAAKQIINNIKSKKTHLEKYQRSSWLLDDSCFCILRY